MAAIKALVKPEMLRWARGRAKVKIENAAKAAHVSVERVHSWEQDGTDDAPTLGQLRNLAAAYHFPLAVFYLPAPPKDFAPLRDFRRLRQSPLITGFSEFHPSLSAALTTDASLRLSCSTHSAAGQSRSHRTPALLTTRRSVGRNIRDFLKIDTEGHTRAARQGRAFDYWRRRLEENDVLVFVISGPHWSVELREMRGFAIAMRELPVLVVNGKDYSQGGKAFTLAHELCHVLLG